MTLKTPDKQLLVLPHIKATLRQLNCFYCMVQMLTFYQTVFFERTVLQSAISSCNIKLIKLLLNAGSDVNASVHIEGKQTALQSAVGSIYESGRRLEVV